MKRMVCLLLSLLLLFTSVMAVAEKDANTQPEKMMLQFVNGSGIKAAVFIQTSGNKEWARRLAALNDRNIQFSMIDGTRNNGFQYMLYLREGDQMAAKSEILSDGNGTGWIRSDFLPDSLISFPTEHDVISSLAGLDTENPAWYLSALRMLLVSETSWQESWEPRLAEAYLSLDSWMNAMGGTPEILDTDEGKRMLYRCEISADELKKQMKAMTSLLLGNQQLMSLVSKQVSREEEALYLHEGYQWYYEQCIDALPLEGSIVLERQVTALGETVSTMLSLPVAGVGTLKEINLSQQDKTSRLSLIYADKTLTVTGEKLDDTMTEGEFRYQAEGEKSIFAHYTLQTTFEEGVVDNDRNTETYTWLLKAEPALSQADEAENVLDFAPVQLDATALLYSRQGDKRVTTMEYVMTLDADECRVEVTAKAKSSNEWDLPAAPAERVTRDLTDMTAEERAELWQDWCANFLLGVSVLPKQASGTEAPQPTEAPELPEATVIPIPEMTAAPQETSDASAE